jgi:hypothetical protein
LGSKKDILIINKVGVKVPEAVIHWCRDMNLLTAQSVPDAKGLHVVHFVNLVIVKRILMEI